MGRPGFKPGGWRHAPLGGFDSHLLPPEALPPEVAWEHVMGSVVQVAGFEFPDGLYYQADDETWARLEGDGTATVGITGMGIAHAGGEIYLCRPKAVGQRIDQRRALAIVELAKAVVAVKSPVSGEVVMVNEALGAEPERVHRDPYGDGWIARLRLLDFERDLAQLVHGDAVAAAMQRMAWLFNEAERP